MSRLRAACMLVLLGFITMFALGGACVRFNVAPGVSTADEILIRRGINDSASYLDANVGGAPKHLVVVNVLTTDTCGSTASLTNHQLCFDTAHPVWTSSTDYQKAKIAAHEYFHALQDELGCVAMPPLWLIEGGAEYVGYQAVIADGLVASAVVETFHVSNVVHSSPPLSSLAQLEQHSAPGAIYSLFYLAVEQLVRKDGVIALRRFCESVAGGQEWHAAFDSAFGMSVQQFYAEFEAFRSSLR